MYSDSKGLSCTEQTIDNGHAGVFTRVWRPTSRPRAVVAICHGLNSHSGQYFWAAGQLVARGFAVYAVDLRGRGRSPGERFYIEHIAEYTSDLDALIDHARSSEGDLPIYLLGHSAGGVTSCVYALEHQAKLAGLICESFAFRVPAPDVALSLVKGLSHIAPHAHVMRLKNEDFSRNPDTVAEMNADPLIADETQPAQTVAALVRADERLEIGFPQIVLPLLILHGTADKATKPSGSEFFHETAGSRDKTLRLYEGHFHDLLNDIGRERVMSDVIAWIEARLP